ncbi:MAG: hypothetical protein R3B84_21355 [Zavarzinella sp.]
MRYIIALIIAVSLDSARAAEQDLGPYYPKDSFAMLSVDLNKMVMSPFGKKVFGTDDKFTSAVKLITLYQPSNDLEQPMLSAKMKKVVGTVVNKLERVTTVVSHVEPKEKLFDFRIVTFVEGSVTENEYANAFEVLANESNVKLDSENRIGRKWFDLSAITRVDGLMGVLAKKGLFLIFQRVDAENILEIISGKTMPAMNKKLITAVASVKPDETSVYLVVAGNIIDTAQVTLSFKGDAELSGKYEGDLAETIEQGFLEQVESLTVGTSRSARLWAAAKLTVARKDKTVTLNGKFSAKLLAEEYGKIKVK